MTFLAIRGNNAIALPLSSGFPASELGYIINNSEASVLISSQKFKAKTDEVTKAGLEKPLLLHLLDKKLQGNASTSAPSLIEPETNQGGMMLYTSGTTSRPVSATQSRCADATDMHARKGSYYQSPSLPPNRDRS